AAGARGRWQIPSPCLRRRFYSWLLYFLALLCLFFSLLYRRPVAPSLRRPVAAPLHAVGVAIRATQAPVWSFPVPCRPPNTRRIRIAAASLSNPRRLSDRVAVP